MFCYIWVYQLLLTYLVQLRMQFVYVCSSSSQAFHLAVIIKLPCVVYPGTLSVICFLISMEGTTFLFEQSVACHHSFMSYHLHVTTNLFVYTYWHDKSNYHITSKSCKMLGLRVCTRRSGGRISCGVRDTQPQ